MGKNHIERLLYIDDQLRKQRYPPRQAIADEFEVSIKTVERDLDYMRDRLHAPIEYDRSRRGFYYSNEGFYLPALYLSEGQAMELFISHNLGTAWRGTPFADIEDSSWSLIRNLMPETLEIPPAAFSEHVMVIDNTVPINTGIWLDLLKAAVCRQKVKLDYKVPGHKTTLERTIHPYRLIFHRQAWYIIGFDEKQNDLRTFSVARIQTATLQKTKFSIQASFKLEDHIDPDFGLFRGHEEFNVKIICSNKIADMLGERLHSKKIIRTDKDDKSEITFTTNQLVDLKHFALQWGTGIEVIEPVELRLELVELGKGLLKMYSN